MGMFDNYTINNTTIPNNLIKFLDTNDDYSDVIEIGSTVKHFFNIPLKISDIKDFVVSYKQGVNILIEKKASLTCSLHEYEDNTSYIQCELTPEESSLFSPLNRETLIQVSIKAADDSVLYSNTYKILIRDTLNKHPFNTSEGGV